MMNLNDSSTQTTLGSQFDFSSIKTDAEHPLHEEIEKKLFVQNNKTDSMTETPINTNLFQKAIWEMGKTKMNENDILKTFIEKVDRDQSDLKIDIRESEKRTSDKINKMEERMDARLNRIEDAIAKSVESTDEKMDDLKKTVDSKMNWVIGTCLATIIGIAGIAGALFLTLRAGA